METQNNNQIQHSNPVVEVDGGKLSVLAREQSEIQAAIVSAKRFPRDEATAYAKVIKSFERPTIAEGAVYSFPRGGKKVTGPSVQCARELARCWGNIRYGLRVVSVDPEYVQIKGYACDLETNSYVESEDKFARKIPRRNKQTGVTDWIEPDERELRELMNRRGAILVRNAILQVIPPDVIDDAMNKAMQTIQKKASGELKTNKEDTIRKLVLAFDDLGVNADMLEKRLGHAISLITEDEIAELKAVWKSIHDGNSSRRDYFEFETESTALNIESPT